MVYRTLKLAVALRSTKVPGFRNCGQVSSLLVARRLHQFHPQRESRTLSRLVALSVQQRQEDSGNDLNSDSVERFGQLD